MARQDFLRGELLMLAFTMLRASALRQSPGAKLLLLHPEGV
jgi:hypothetical protein